MAILPFSSHALLVRTCFVDEPVWDVICAESTGQSEEGFQADVLTVSDRSFEGLSWETVKRAVPSNTNGSRLVFVADAVCFESSDHPLLVVDLIDSRGMSLTPFRCTTRSLWAVENNLNEANMDWDDFTAGCDEDGVFRGF